MSLRKASSSITKPPHVLQEQSFDVKNLDEASLPLSHDCADARIKLWRCNHKSLEDKVTFLVTARNRIRRPGPEECCRSYR